MSGVKITAICGSYRKESFNRKLLCLCVRELEQAGAQVDVVDLKALALPVYDGDEEEAHGLPARAHELKERISASAGLLIVTPEYNSSVPGGLKNAIDWASRPAGNPFRGKVICVCGSSDGALAATKGVLVVRNILAHLGGWVVPGGFTFPHIDKTLDAEGEVTEAWMKKEIAGSMARLLEGVRAFAPA